MGTTNYWIFGNSGNGTDTCSTKSQQDHERYKYILNALTTIIVVAFNGTKEGMFHSQKLDDNMHRYRSHRIHRILRKK